VDRAKNITLTPAAEWPVIAAEPATAAGIYTGYVIPLAAIGPVCAFIAQALFLHHLILGLLTAALSFVLVLVGVFVISFIADALATSFGGTKDSTQALKWVAYANTPGWIAGVANLIPVLGSFIVLLASLYGLYVLYLGVVPMIKVPQDKAIGYTVVVIVCDIILFALVGGLVGVLVFAMGAGAVMSSGAYSH
jgi:hypothetical protein